MASFKPDLPQLKELYDQWGADLYALCFLQGGRPAYAQDLVISALCDMASNPGLHTLALSGREGFLRAGYLTCRDASYRRPKRLKRRKDAPQEGPRPALPFLMTDSLRKLMKLRLPLSASLFCRERLELQPDAAGRLLGCSPLREERLHSAALKKAGITQGQAKAVLESLAPREGDLTRAWEEFQHQQSQPSFGARQRFRRMRRALDAAVPYLALGVVVLCAAAYFGVEYGWFGTAYTPTQPVEGVVVEEGYDGDAASDTLAVGDVTVYVPEEGGFAQYIVHNTPQSPQEVLRQMVLLGGAPEGVSLLSSHLENSDDLQSLGTTLTMELSDQAASLSGEEGERMLQAMTATFAGYTDHLETLSIRCQGQELTVNGKTAQDFLGTELTIIRTTETDYRS
ncbi:MAG: hypothetical protein ACOYJZ_05540 [Acutalibacter sp.]